MAVTASAPQQEQAGAAPNPVGEGAPHQAVRPHPVETPPPSEQVSEEASLTINGDNSPAQDETAAVVTSQGSARPHSPAPPSPTASNWAGVENPPQEAKIESNTSDSALPVDVDPLDISPVVQVFHDTKGVLIKWTLPKKYIHLQEGVKLYELYAYIVKRGSDELPPISQWSKVGVIKPLKLPMAVTLTNVVKTKKYAFAVRALFGKTASQYSKPSSLREDLD